MSSDLFFCDFGEAALEEAALGIGADERERCAVCSGGFGFAAEAAEQVGARGVEQVVAGELVGMR